MIDKEREANNSAENELAENEGAEEGSDVSD